MIGLSVKKRVGMRVRAARKAAGMTQQDLADRIGLTRTSVVNLEAGNQDMPVTRLAVVAEVLKLDLADLVREGDLPPQPHNVMVRRIWEAVCETCGGLVIDCCTDRAQVLESKRAHIEAKRDES